MGRRANGEGSIYATIQKVKRKKFDTRGECAICRECTDRTLCNNRIDHIKYDKCKNCKDECLKYCDRFYCQRLKVAQISVKGKKKTVGSDTAQKTKKEKIVMGATTKTGRKNIKSNNSATHFIPFDVFDKEQLIDIL